MITSAPVILTIVAGGLFIGAIIKPAWPLCAVGGLLLSVAVLVFLYNGK